MEMKKIIIYTGWLLVTLTLLTCEKKEENENSGLSLSGIWYLPERGVPGYVRAVEIEISGTTGVIREFYKLHTWYSTNWYDALVGGEIGKGTTYLKNLKRTGDKTWSADVMAPIDEYSSSYNAPPDKYYTAQITWQSAAETPFMNSADASSVYLQFVVQGVTSWVIDRTAEKIPDYLRPPYAVKVNGNSSSIVVSWQASPWATAYEVFKSTDLTNWSSIGTTGSTSFTDRNPEFLNAYKIRAKTATLTSAYSEYESIFIR
jgi:hypothetical protein